MYIYIYKYIYIYSHIYIYIHLYAYTHIPEPRIGVLNTNPYNGNCCPPRHKSRVLS